MKHHKSRLSRLFAAGILSLSAFTLSACSDLVAGSSNSNNVSLIVSPTTNELYVFNLLNHRVIDRLETGARPDDLAVSSDSRRILVSNINDGSISVFERLTGTEFIGRGKINVQGTKPQGVAFNNDGRRAYVSIGDTASIAVLDTSIPSRLPNLVRSVRIPFNNASANRPSPSQIAVSQDGNRLFVIDQANGALLAFNQTQADNFTVSEVFRPDPQSRVEFRDVIVDRSNRVYVIDSSNDQLLVFNGGNIQQPVAQVTLKDAQFPVISPENIAINNSGTRLYITGSAANVISVINQPSQLQGNTLIQQAGGNIPINTDQSRPATSPTGIDITSNDQEIYVTNGGGGFNISLLESTGQQVRPVRNIGTAASAANAPPLGRMKIIFFNTLTGQSVPRIQSEDASTPDTDTPASELSRLPF